MPIAAAAACHYAGLRRSAEASQPMPRRLTGCAASALPRLAASRQASCSSAHREHGAVVEARDGEQQHWDAAVPRQPRHGPRQRAVGCITGGQHAVWYRRRRCLALCRHSRRTAAALPGLLQQLAGLRARLTCWRRCGCQHVEGHLPPGARANVLQHTATWFLEAAIPNMTS